MQCHFSLPVLQAVFLLFLVAQWQLRHTGSLGLAGLLDYDLYWRMRTCFVAHHPRSLFTTLLTRARFYGPFHCSYIFVPRLAFRKRRIFIFGVLGLGYSKLEALLEGLRRLMSYKVALHVLVTFTEQVVPIHKHITVLYSEFPRYQEQKQSQ